MSKTMMNFTKGVVAGVVFGTTVGVMLSNISKPVSPIKKNTAKMIKTAGNVINGLNNFMK